MEYINGTITSAQDIGVKSEKTNDSRRYLSQMTWEEYEKYLKSIAKRSRK